MKKASLLVLMLMSLGLRAALADPCPSQFPVSRGTGTIAGVPVAGGTQYYFKDALLNGFDCFEELSSWFPSYITASNAISPSQEVVDMAYTVEGTATFSNVVVPTSGNYTLTVRYAYATGLFPGVTERPEGIMVNGVIITSDMSFPVTGDFNSFANSSIVVPLKCWPEHHPIVQRCDSRRLPPGLHYHYAAWRQQLQCPPGSTWRVERCGRFQRRDQPRMERQLGRPRLHGWILQRVSRNHVWVRAICQ